MKVRIDPDVCQGHGQCVIVCDAVFLFDEQGFGYVEREDVSPEHADKVARAELQCPERAIQIER